MRLAVLDAAHTRSGTGHRLIAMDLAGSDQAGAFPQHPSHLQLIAHKFEARSAAAGIAGPAHASPAACRAPVCVRGLDDSAPAEPHHAEPAQPSQDGGRQAVQPGGQSSPQGSVPGAAEGHEVHAQRQHLRGEHLPAELRRGHVSSLSETFLAKQEVSAQQQRLRGKQLSADSRSFSI